MSQSIDEPFGSVEMVPRKAGTAPGRELVLRSPAFAHGATIPTRHTADGDDVSPELSWSAPPAGTESFAILCEDPDAPSGAFVHWLAWNLRPEVRSLPEAVAASSATDALQQGQNDFGTTGYRGPSPPRGAAHRYIFHLYALDTRLELSPGITRSEFEQTIRNHVLAEGRLVGVYQQH